LFKPHSFLHLSCPTTQSQPQPPRAAPSRPILAPPGKVAESILGRFPSRHSYGQAGPVWVGAGRKRPKIKGQNQVAMYCHSPFIYISLKYLTISIKVVSQCDPKSSGISQDACDMPRIPSCSQQLFEVVCFGQVPAPHIHRDTFLGPKTNTGVDQTVPIDVEIF